MRMLVTAATIAIALLGATQLCTTAAIALVARTFCLVAVVVFVAVALLGLASKLRA